jgi:glycosyltransferase involved in cell wall biosynthesis
MPRQHIGLNAQLLCLDENYRGAGINAYIYHLLRQLGGDSPYRYTVFLSEPRFVDPRLALRYSRWPMQRPLARIAWEQLALPALLRRAGAQLLHAMAFVAPLVQACPCVVTIYDLSFLHYPEAFRPFNRWYLSRFTTLTARRARRVIAISESTKRDVVQRLGVPAERVDVVYCGVDETFRPLPDKEVDQFRRQHGLPDQFILFLGTLEPRKNVETLITAYAEWRKSQPCLPQLVLAGGKGWYYEQAFARVQELGLADRVVFPGYLPAAELPWWYNAAEMFVYPSRFEGFGLPVLEAMACGTPVITSNSSSLPEIVGDAGRLVAPNDSLELAATMQEVWHCKEVRRELAIKGVARAARFRWQHTAQQTVESYARALSVA